MRKALLDLRLASSLNDLERLRLSPRSVHEQKQPNTQRRPQQRRHNHQKHGLEHHDTNPATQTRAVQTYCPQNDAN
jgi:hypothetical protein